MDASGVFDEIVKALDEVDEAREKILVLGRKGVRHCSEAIKKLHRREQGVNEALSGARAALNEMLDEASKHPRVNVASHFETLFQELVEAVILQRVFNKDALPCPSEMDPPVPAAQYVLGTCDAIGELRRACLDAIKLERFDEANRFFSIMETLHENVNALDYPNAVIPNVRHKADGNRKLINATRSDLTMAMHIARLNANLSRTTGD